MLNKGSTLLICFPFWLSLPTQIETAGIDFAANSQSSAAA
jgi:hypothetical protein